MDLRWSYFGVTAAFLESKAAWLKEERALHHRSVHFFRLAGKLVSLSRDDYELSSLAFFQAIIGLERALRLHFATDEGVFALLFHKAVAEEIVTDTVFSELRPLPDELLKQVAEKVLPDEVFSKKMPLPKRLLRQLEGVVPTHSHALSILVPKLRNQFMHGTYLLSPEYVHLTLQMREIADALKTKTSNQWGLGTSPGWNCPQRPSLGGRNAAVLAGTVKLTGSILLATGVLVRDKPTASGRATLKGSAVPARTRTSARPGQQDSGGHAAVAVWPTAVARSGDACVHLGEIDPSKKPEVPKAHRSRPPV